MCLKNPNRYYLGSNETIYLLFFGLSLKLIEKSMYGKFQRALQLSPWFMERGTVSGRTNLIYQPKKDIRLDIGSTEEHALSVAVLYCLDYNTEILTENGFVKIGELEDKQIKVYTQNKDGTVVLTEEPVWVKQTGVTNELYEITLENNHKFRCTPNHKLKLKDSSYKEAKFLTIKDELEFVDIYISNINNSIKIKNINRIKVSNVPVYDVIDVPENHNFLIRGHYNKTTHTCIVSHNCSIDEMSFGENDNADYQLANMMKIYNQLYLRLSSRFSKNGKIQGRMYLISSAKSTNAVLESFIKDNENQPGMHVSRYKQWEVLPASKFSGKWFKIAVGNELLTSYIMGVNPTEEEIKEAEMRGYTVMDVPLEMKHRFEMDFNRTLIDSCGISVQSSYKYIPYRLVEPCLGGGVNPFTNEIIKTGLKDNYQIKDFFLPEVVPELLYTKKIYIHCDLSKSGDMTGISAVAVLGYKNQERFTDTGDSTVLKEIVFRHIFSVGLQCPPNDELSMIKVKDFIHYLKYDLGWNIAGVSCDGYQSLMLLQSLKLDGFNVKEVSMDILKNKECVGYTIFRNTLVEQRIKLLKLNELIKEITNLERNETTGRIDHPRQHIKILDDGTRVRSVGKDIVDSLGGSIYNATLSVDLNELDYMNNVILTDGGLTTLSTTESTADKLFGINRNMYGLVDLNPNNMEGINIEEEIDKQIELQLQQSQNIVNEIKKTNPTTKLTNNQIRTLYDDFVGDDFIIL